MEFPQFKYCAFKKFLPNALHLYPPEEVMEKPKKLTILEHSDDEDESITKKPTLKKIKMNNNYLENQDKNDKIINDNNQQLILQVNKENNNSSDRGLNETVGKGEQSMTILKEEEKPFIDFQKFIDVMSLFNGKYPVDLKIRCNYFLLNIFSLL